MLDERRTLLRLYYADQIADVNPTAPQDCHAATASGFVAVPRTQTFRRYIRTASGAATTMMARLHAIAANTLLVDANCPP